MLLELAALLPRVHLHLLLAGPEVPGALDGRSVLFAAPAERACGRAGCSCANMPPGAPLRSLCAATRFQCHSMLVARKTHDVCSAACTKCDVRHKLMP